MCPQRSHAQGLHCATHQIFRLIAGYCAISTTTSCQSLLIKKGPGALFVCTHSEGRAGTVRHGGMTRTPCPFKSLPCARRLTPHQESWQNIYSVPGVGETQREVVMGKICRHSPTTEFTGKYTEADRSSFCPFAPTLPLVSIVFMSSVMPLLVLLFYIK